MTLHILLLVFAFFCFLMSALGGSGKIDLQSLGLAAWVLTFLLA